MPGGGQDKEARIMRHPMNHDDERREFFDRHAAGWEDRNYSTETLDRVRAMLAGLNLQVGSTILDAGCGQGVLIPFLRAIVGDGARLVALDASAPMLAALPVKDPHVTAIHAPAERIPLIDGYVDTVICFSAFPHFSDKPLAAKEFFRVLKPGGAVYVLHLMGSEALCRHHDRHHAVQGDYLPCPHGMRTMFGEAGFTAMELHDSPERYHFCAVKPEEPARPGNASGGAS